jgi:membrane protein DedA with SNARE-associated domain
MEFLERLVQEHGTYAYLITFVWTFFEGETFVLGVAFMAAQGLLSAPLLLAAAWLGSFAGDQCWFWIGRNFGLRWLAKRPAWRSRVDIALGWVKRFDAGFILTFRFIYGIRNVSSFALGISGVGWQRFLILNFIAAGLWAMIFIGAGYLFGHAFERMLGDYAERIKLILLGIVCAVALIAYIIYRWRRRRPIEATLPPS